MRITLYLQGFPHIALHVVILPHTAIYLQDWRNCEGSGRCEEAPRRQRARDRSAIPRRRVLKWRQNAQPVAAWPMQYTCLW